MRHLSHLLRTSRFMPLFTTQFLGALNDNVLKNAVVVLLTFQAARWSSARPEILANLAAGLFILPFFLFSATAGQLADKYDKARLARGVKLLEIVIMLVAGIGLWKQDLSVLMLSIFLLGLHSTLFGPVKYAILPQHLRAEELVAGNALVEAATFVAILLGTLMGGLLASLENAPLAITLAGLTIAMTGYLASRRIPTAAAPCPELKINVNPLTETWRNIRLARENREVWIAIIGISWFWLYGAVFLAQFPAYTKYILGAGETAVTLLLTAFSLGIGLGSLLCERWSAGRLEVGMVLPGIVGLGVFGLDLMWSSPATPAGEMLGVTELLAHAGTWRILLDLILIGLFGGIYIVPLYTLMLERSQPTHRARIVAANNIFNALYMVIGALSAMVLLGAGLSLPALFGVAAAGNVLVGIYLVRQAPALYDEFKSWLARRGA